MIVQGVTGVTGQNGGPFPTHQIGDLLLLFVRGISVPIVPAASPPYVPTWTIAQAAAANSIALTCAWTFATSATMEAGVWTGGTHHCLLVLRADTGKQLVVGVISVGNGNNTQTIVYPALTLTTLAGTAWGVRCGTRGVAVTAVGTAPTGWTAQRAQPLSTGALMSLHTRAALVAHPVADSVATAGTNSAYRAQTLQVNEQLAQQPMVTIA